MNARCLIATLLLSSGLGACSAVPAYHRPAPPIPATFPGTEGSQSAAPALRIDQMFGDARLRRLIDQALITNRDLRIAAANIAAARAQYHIQRAEQLPVINSNNTVQFNDPGTGRTSNGGSPVTGGERTNYLLSIGLNQFEIDLFGRLAALTQAEQARYFASEAGARAARLTLVGDIATAWLQYGAGRSLLKIAERTRDNARDSVRLTRARTQGGVAPRSDLSQAEQVLATAEADHAALTATLAQDGNALALLIGQPVDPALLPDDITDAGAAVADLPAGLDTAVLLARPDVVAAEYQLRAANAQVGAARAALLPRVSLTALAGLASNGLSQLFTSRAFTYTATPGVSYPLFAGGGNRAGVELARAQFDAAVATYEKTLQVAFREAADALARRATVGDQLAADEHLVAAASDTSRLAEARYRGGVDSFLASLDAQRSLYQAERALVAARLMAAANRVTLYRALGGDSGTAQPDPTPKPQ